MNKLNPFLLSCLGFLMMLGAFDVGDSLKYYDVSNTGYDRLSGQSWQLHPYYSLYNGLPMSFEQLFYEIAFVFAFVSVLIFVMMKIPLK